MGWDYGRVGLGVRGWGWVVVWCGAGQGVWGGVCSG